MQGNSGVLAGRLFLGYVVIAIAAVLYLPYLFPLTPTASSSYLFGYNNRVGEALLLAFVILGAVWTRGLHMEFAGSSDSPPVSHKTLAWCLIAVLLGCLAMYVLVGRLGGFGESSYEIDRVWLTSQGKLPYVDFEWPFGLVLIYGPLVLHRLFPMDLVQAYYLFWALNCLLGVWLLFAVVNAIDYPSPRKNVIFLLVYCAWFISITNMGTHYTLTRYTLPLFFILMVQKLIRNESRGLYLLGGALIAAFTAILVLYSPEIAIAFAMASVVLLFLQVTKRRNWESFAASAVLLSALGAIFWLASKLHILDTVKASGGGADSFPIVLSPHIMLFFVAFFVCACYVYCRLAGQPIKDNSIGMIIISIPMLAAALGRCDPGHVAFNNLGIFLAALFYASAHTRAWKYARLAFIVIMVVLPTLGGLWFFLPSLAKSEVGLLAIGGPNSKITRIVMGAGKFYIDHFGAPEKKEKWRQRLEDRLHGTTSQSTELAVIYPQWKGNYLAPFGYKPNGVGTYLSTRVDYGRYEAIENANTLAAINEKITEIRDNPAKAILLPDHYESTCEVDVPSERRYIEVLFAFPYFRRPAHPESVRRPICTYIQEHYTMEVEPSRENAFYGLWINRQGAESLQR
jgi:hypothetical protein